MATSSQAQTDIAKYVGTLYGFIPGGFMPALENIYNDYFPGNMAQMMSSLGRHATFTATLPAGSDRDVAQVLASRLLTDQVSKDGMNLVVDYLAASHANGMGWGDLMFVLVRALDGITTGPWADAASQMRTRADYALTASQGWASDVTDMGTLRDIFSYAGSPTDFRTGNARHPTAAGLEVPVTHLTNNASALDTAAAGLGAQTAGTSYTISSADAGRAVLMGEGDDTVTMSYATLGVPAFISGGGGNDTLVLKIDGIVDYLNTHGGYVYSQESLRGFENIVFDPGNIKLEAPEGLLNYSTTVTYTSTLKILSVNNGSVFNINMSNLSNGYSDIDFGMPTPLSQQTSFENVYSMGILDQPTLESVTFNYTNANGNIYNDIMARNVTVSATGINNSASTFYWHPFSFNDFSSGNSALVLERLTVKGNMDFAHLYLDAPNLRALNFADQHAYVSARIENLSGASTHDGLIDMVDVTAPDAVMAFNYKLASIQNADTGINFTNQLRAGSYVAVNYGWAYNQNVSSSSLPVLKADFDTNFSGLNYLNQRPDLAEAIAQINDGAAHSPAGSVFNIQGLEKAAVYFRGDAGAGQTLGTLIVKNSNQNVTVKFDHADGINLTTTSVSQNTMVNFINSGSSGSVLDRLKSSIQNTATTYNATTFHDQAVDGGRVMWIDSTFNDRLDTGDVIYTETTTANLAQFNHTLELMGLAQVVDYFA